MRGLDRPITWKEGEVSHSGVPSIAGMAEGWPLISTKLTFIVNLIPLLLFIDDKLRQMLNSNIIFYI